MQKIWKYSLLLMVVAILAGCRSEFEAARLSGDPALILKTANKMYDNDEYLRAKELYTLILTSYRGTSEAEKLYFTYAYCHYHLGDFISSAYYFESFTNTYPNSQYREEAQYMKAYSNYQLSPTYRLTQESTLEAIDDFQQFVNRYPNSERVPNCNNYIDELRRKLEKKAFNEGVQYYDLGNFQSAMHVFENVLKDYPDTRDAQNIRFLIVKSAFLWAENSIYEKQAERYDLTLEKFKTFRKKYATSSYDDELEDMKKQAELQLKKFKDV